MKKIFSFCLIFVLFTTAGTFLTFAEALHPVANASNVSIEPRANVVDVLSYQEYLTDRYGHTTLVSQTYRRLTYVNGYEISLIQPENITTTGDILNGATRKSYTYFYRTW